jgi:hypothetical protein
MKSSYSYCGNVRDDIDRAECSVSQLKVRTSDSEPTESDNSLGFYRRECQPLEQLFRRAVVMTPTRLSTPHALLGAR